MKRRDGGDIAQTRERFPGSRKAIWQVLGDYADDSRHFIDQRESWAATDTVYRNAIDQIALSLPVLHVAADAPFEEAEIIGRDSWKTGPPDIDSRQEVYFLCSELKFLMFQRESVIVLKHDKSQVSFLDREYEPVVICRELELSTG